MIQISVKQMCGIAGIYSVSGGVSKEPLEIMSKRLEHRGPDGCGIKIFDKYGLVHRRLSIIDLSENASQPMCNEDETLNQHELLHFLTRISLCGVNHKNL